MSLILIMSLLFIFILSIAYTSEEQLYPISGTVIDESGKPIENVSVLINTLEIGTATDATGYFSLMVEEGSYELLFSHIGYENQKIRLPNNTTSRIILKISSIKNEQLVITSNRKKTHIKDSPIITHVITRDDINKASYSTVDELIEFAMPNTQSTHDNHGEDKIKIQGLDNKYTTFLIDGNRVTGEFAGNIDFSQFNMNNIERVEVIRGGLSTVYGSGAMGGVVNIITENNPNSMYININSFYDMPKIFSNSLGFGIGYQKISYSGNINYSTTNGYDLTPPNFNSNSDYIPINKTLDEYTAILLNQKISFNINNESTISLNYKYYVKNIYKYEFIDNDNKTYLYEELPVFKNETIRVNYKKTLNKFSTISFNHQNEKYSKSFYLPYYYEENDSYTINGETFLWSTPNTSTSSILYNTRLNTHQLLIGLDYIYQSYSSVDIPNTGIESIFGEDATKKMNETSIFILDNFKYYNIDFNLGARINYHSKYRSRISPSISLMKIINNYNYRLNFNQSYRVPSLKEIYYSYEGHPGLPVYGNENLKPSISNYYSLSIESREYINNSIEFYYNNVSDMILYDTIDQDGDNYADAYQYFNEKHVNLYGFNITTMINPLKKVTVNTIYTYTEAKSDYDEILDGISAHSVNCKLKYNPLKNWDVLFSTKFNSSKTVDTSMPDLNDNRNEIVLPSYTISDLSITKSFKDRSYVKMGMKNIFNYIDKNNTPALQDFLSTYQPGRSFFLNINFKLSKDL